MVCSLGIIMYSVFNYLLVIILYFGLINISNAASGGSVKHLESINLEITTHLGDAQTFVEGDQISFMLSLDKASFIYLFYQDAEGNILQLVPNHKQTTHFYQPGLFIPIPDQLADFKFTVQPPFGEEKLWAFATDTQVDSFNSTQDSEKLELLNQPIDEIRSKIKYRAKTMYGESLLTIFVTGG